MRNYMKETLLRLQAALDKIFPTSSFSYTPSGQPSSMAITGLFPSRAVTH